MSVEPTNDIIITSDSNNEVSDTKVLGMSPTNDINRNDVILSADGENHSDITDTFSRLPENSLTTSEGNLSSNASIIITNEGIVFPPGSIMLTRHLGEEGSVISETLDNTATSDGGAEFDIKVESNALKQISNAFKLQTDSHDNNSTDQTSDSASLIMNQNVLSSVTGDSDDNLQEINFTTNNGHLDESEHITQFQVQTPSFSLANLQQNLQKINRNVLMSQAALPEDSNVSKQQVFLCTVLDPASEVKSSNDPNKRFLTSDTFTDENGHLFIKNEQLSGVNPQESGTNSNGVNEIVKSENILSSVKQKTGNESRMQSLVFGEAHLISIPATTANNSTSQQNIRDNERKRKLNSDNHQTTKQISIASKLTEVDKTPGLRTLAPRLLSYPLYAGAQAGLGSGKSLLKTYNYGTTTLQLLEPGQYFEVLGRCISCFRFSRTTSYCRAEKNHREPKSSVCIECESAGVSTVVCRRKLNHTAPNAQPLNIVINTALQTLEHVKQLCVRNYLPACFAELHSIVVHHADITFVAPRSNNKTTPEEDIDLIDSGVQPLSTANVLRKPTDYARGYLYPYAKEKWEQWLAKFCHQTGTTYKIRTGKRVNKKTDHHGLANHNGKIITYRTLETQLYNCALGGRPRKRKPREGIRKRKERGSKLLGCSAVIHTRLIETELGWKSLEVTVPKTLAHLPCHDPRLSSATDLLTNFGEVIVSQISPQLQQYGINTQPASTNFDLVSIVADTNEPNTAKERSPVEMRKNTKNLLVTCASLLDTIENADVITSVQVQAQELLNKLLQEASLNKAPPARKRRKKSIETQTPSELVTDELMASMNDVINVI